MYRQFTFAALHWRFSSDGKPDSGGGSYFEHSLFVTWLKQKVPCHDFSVHNKKCNVITTCSQLCGLHLRPQVIVSVTSVVYSGESKEFNPHCPKAVSCTCFELMGWKTTSCNCVLFSILCGMQCMRKAEAFKSGFSSNLSGSVFLEANAVWQQWLPNLSTEIILLQCWWSLQGRYFESTFDVP